MSSKILSSLIPSRFFDLYNKLRIVPEKPKASKKPKNPNNPNTPDDPNELFAGDDDLFKEEVNDAEIYGEYGCGKSTKWVLNNTSAKVIAVDTSKDWINEVENDTAKNHDRLNIHHVDLGELGKWGRPTSYVRREFFADYTDYLWNQAEKPDLVLVDGRFRVCCFLTCLKFAEEGTRILFDDYTDRAYYHFVEKYVSRFKECGRQCLFIVPPKRSIDFAELDRDIDAFRHVFD